jgi:syntaxin-binding protein 1
MLEDLCRGALDPAIFPYTIPPADPNEDMVVQGSLRSAAPKWASVNRRQAENRQRIIVFVAGGATYSESRVCYETSEKNNRDIFLVTSHMVTPQMFIRQTKDLSMDRRRLDLPMDRPKPRAPAHLFERPAPPPMQRPPPPSAPGSGSSAGNIRPPTKSLGAMTLNSGTSSSTPTPSQASGMEERPSAAGLPDGGKLGKLHKDKDKKKRNLFGIKK